MEIPATTRDITVGWLNHVLHENGLLKDVNVVSLKHEPMGAGKGLLSDMARLTLAYDRDARRLPSTMIAKFPPTDEYARTATLRHGYFEREIRFYREVAPKSPIRTPVCYYGAIDPERQRYALLLQDCGGYAEADPQLQGLNLEQTKIVVAKLAGFHARWWNEGQSLFPWIPVFNSAAMEQAYVNAFKSLWDSVAQTPGFRESLPERGWETGLKISRQCQRLFETAPVDNLTIYHADMKTDNMFFDWSTPGDPFVLFDWSLVRIGRGATDLSYLLGLSVSLELRRSVEKEMFALYHDCLVERGVTEYSFDECWSDYLRGLLVCAVFPLAQVRLAREARAVRLAETGLRRIFSAVVDNETTRILQ